MLTLSPFFGVVHQLASGLYRNLSEFVRTCAIYLGISVLVAGVMVFTMPTLRGQALQIHSALLYALVPEALLPQPLANTSAPVGPIVAAVDLEPIHSEILLPSVSPRQTAEPVVVLPPATSRADLAVPLVSLPAVTAPPAELPANAPASAPASAATSAATPAPVAPAPEAAAAAAPPAVVSPAAAAVTSTAPAPVSALAQALQRQALSAKQLEALMQYLSRKYLVAHEAAKMFVETAYLVGDELKVDPLLILAIIATESRFNPYAGGPVGGATGLMQVMISVHREKFSKYGRGGEVMAFNPVANIRVGAFILADCIKRRGSVAEGLLCYCGASSPTSDGGYTEKVLSERRRLALAGSIALRD